MMSVSLREGKEERKLNKAGAMCADKTSALLDLPK